MKSLDTNTLLRLLLADVPSQTSIVEKLLTETSQKFAVADMVFAEIVWILQGKQYNYERQLIIANLESIIAIKHVNCNRKMLCKAMPLYLTNKKISFIDACLTAYAELNDATPLLTFDKKLAVAAPRLVTLLKA